MITLHHVSKEFEGFQAVKAVSLKIDKGEIHGIIGASGAGKSTLLRLINLLEVPEAGQVEVNGQDLTKLRGNKLREARKAIGMIFQHFNLVANKTVYENVAVSLQLSGFPWKKRRQRVMECLQFVGMEGFVEKYPAQLSGGQKQRVAIARALANNPQVLLCDEPTSSLDPNTTAEVLRVLENVNRSLGVTVVVVSHEMEVIKSICHNVTVMANGEVYESVRTKPQGVKQIDSNPQYFVDQLVKEAVTDDA
ncbi:methionine ABC transporter ATP-binding protein [Sutcliffiella horikoshii]|uniref:methionine ABC transporter ATP-binding protein n=1 Tax=Sutcliffiella horikoshii TaxID=79883 RepID=UPI001EEE303D|nr:ATP-binding cassette domain-containing protein [Sutcliffiella horikoshii]MCG1021149.1 ATP-binding cassette domain-containing protein [Sutcliffiella horikoshii]